MATIEEIREADRASEAGMYHEETRDLGYRFCRKGPGVVIERSRIENGQHVAGRMITPFRDITNEYELVADSRGDSKVMKEWDRRRKALADAIDFWLDQITLPVDRPNAYRCWSFEQDETPHLICRYSTDFKQLISGSSWTPPNKFLAIGRAVNKNSGIVELGTTVTADTLEDLARLCLKDGAGIKIGPSDFAPQNVTFLIVDLDRQTAEEGTFSQFRSGLEDGFRIW